MRKSLLFGAMLLIASCTVHKETEFESPSQHRFHAVAEDPVDSETRVYADSKLRVRWNEGDHISIFERTTYNQEFEFLGDTGDTAGDFDPVESSGYHTGGDIEDGHVYAIYPYDKKNKCDYEGKMTVTFPSTQHYKKDSFGIGANIMVAKTSTMDLRFMHVGGYRTFKLYGEGVSVSSIKIESNGDEFLSGRTDVTIGSDGKAAVSFIESTSNSKSVELVCDTPVALGSTAEEYVEFWFVLPPGTLSQGFSVTITDSNGNEFTKSTSNSIEIKSGVKKSMAAFEVGFVNTQPNNEIWYTTVSGYSVSPSNSGISIFGAEILSNEYKDGRGVIRFSSEIDKIGMNAFKSRYELVTISLPNSITSIEGNAFLGCYHLESINIPEHVSSIGNNAFGGCRELESLVLPENVTSIGVNAFEYCSSLVSLTIPESVSSIGEYAFDGCDALKRVIFKNPSPIPCDYLFHEITNCKVFVPSSSTSIYKSSEGWRYYSDRIFAIPEYVDLGLSVKWAAFNIGASTPAEYGDYYAWGEIATKTRYSWSNYSWNDPNSTYNDVDCTTSGLTKYCTNEPSGQKGTYDGKTHLDPEDDVAYVGWGEGWRMPTKQELIELYNCPHYDTTRDGIKVTVFTGSNGTLSLPWAGYYALTDASEQGERMLYRASEMTDGYPYMIRFDYGGETMIIDLWRHFGFPVRAVYQE